MEEVRKVLLEEKEKILKSLEESSSTEPIDHDVGDDIDSSVDEQGRELMLLLRDRDRIKLEQIEKAIERINRDEYGDCEECGEEIEKKRLMILPFAKLCLSCKTEQERLQGKSLVSFDDDNARYVDSDD